MTKDQLERENARLVDRVATLEQVLRLQLDADLARSEAERCMSESRGFTNKAIRAMNECIALLLGEPIIPNN